MAPRGIRDYTAELDEAREMAGIPRLETLAAMQRAYSHSPSQASITDRVLDLLTKFSGGDGFSPSEIAGILHLPVRKMPAVRKALMRFVKRGLVRHNRHGRYQARGLG